jgi:hypothetical protein
MKMFYLLTGNSFLKLRLVGVILLLLLIGQTGIAGGAVCIYVNGAGEVVCTPYSSSGLPEEAACASEARASNPDCGLDMFALNSGAGGCATGQIFISATTCLSSTPPHNIISGQTQASCEAAGNRWCPSSYYGFFKGDADCRAALCGAANTILPIDLIGFHGFSEGVNNHITWITASEMNNDYYVLEHSTDGFNWTSLGSILGSGNSSEIKGYRFIHMMPERLMNYYRLYQVDYDGASARYGPILVDNTDKKRTLLYMTNIMGQEVTENCTGIVIYYYDDGTTEKIYR